MILNNKTLLVIMILLAFLISCSGGNMPEEKVTFQSIKDVPVNKWQKLSGKRIYFGHRSVGNNIIAGIVDLMKENPHIKLNIVETCDKVDFRAGLFAHSKVGENGNPRSKIDAFEDFMDNGIGGKADIACFKFCFADIKADTNFKKVFLDYMNTMSQLKKRYPDTIFVHVTVPLGITRTTWRTWIKKLMGKKEIWEYDHNVARNKFNELLKKEYGGKEPVFDLAKVEFTYPDGRAETFTKKEKRYYSLVPDYTHDGSHLNELGRKIVAEQLLILLANLNK